MRYRYLDGFRSGISVFAIFSYGIAVLGTPQCPPPFRFALFCFTSLRFALFLLIIESQEMKFCVLKFKSPKGCDYNLYCSDTDCAILLPLNRAKFIRYSAARPFFHWFGLSRACMDNQVFF